MGIARKFKRKVYNKEKKALKKAAKQVSSRLNMLGNKCANCEERLDKRDLSQLESWSVYQNHTGVHVVCPRCQVEIEELKKQMIENEVVDAEIGE